MTLTPTTPVPTTPSDYMPEDMQEDWQDWLDHTQRVDPEMEFHSWTESLNLATLGALVLSWFAITVPLVLGLKSLLQSFYLAFILTHFFNLLLFFRALTLPGLGDGLNFMFRPRFSEFDSSHVWLGMFYISVGLWCCARYGVLFVIGKHIKETTFAFPSVLLAVIAVFLFNLLNLFKISGFMGYFGKLPGTKYSKYSYSSYHCLPVVLSVQPGATFWLIVHFAFTLCSTLPSSTLIFEVVVSSVAELLPASWVTRDQFPRSLAVPGVLGLLGFGGSVLALCVRADHRYHSQLYHFLNFTYFLAIIFFVQAIAFLSLSKVATIGHEDLLAFVKRQSTALTATAFKVLVGVSFVIAGFLAYILVPFFPWVSLGFSIGVSWSHFGSTIFFFVLLALTLLSIFGTVLVQSILFCCDGKKYPCCLPIGKQLVDSEENIDDVEMHWLVTNPAEVGDSDNHS